MNAQEYVDRYFGPCVDFVKKHGYADWDGSANGQTITLTGCANMMAEMLRCRDEEASQPKPEPSVAPENISISIVSEAKGIVPKGAVYISKEHFNRLCQLAAKHKYGRCDCFDSAPPVAQHETLAPAQQETLAAEPSAAPLKFTLDEIITALDYASESRNNWNAPKPDLLGNHLNRVLAAKLQHNSDDLDCKCYACSRNVIEQLKAQLDVERTAPAEVTAEHFAAKLTLGIQNMSTADVPNGAGHMESWIRKSDVLRLLAAAKGK